MPRALFPQMLCYRPYPLRANLAFLDPTTFRALHTTRPSSANSTPSPSATSTSAAQPFSTPLTPSPSKNPTQITTKSKPSPNQSPKSSVPAGTPLRGLTYLKPTSTSTNEILARPDEDYPPWLWTLLPSSSSDPSSSSNPSDPNATGNVGDAFAKSRKMRRIAAKAERARAAQEGEGAVGKQVPIEEQSVDLRFGVGGEEARGEREGLTRAMRGRRRAGIKEGNFLRGMR